MTAVPSWSYDAWIAYARSQHPAILQGTQRVGQCPHCPVRSETVKMAHAKDGRRSVEWRPCGHQLAVEAKPPATVARLRAKPRTPRPPEYFDALADRLEQLGRGGWTGILNITPGSPDGVVTWTEHPTENGGSGER